MLYSVSTKIAYCYPLGARCKDPAARAVTTADRQFYSRREQDWLKRARSHELQERLDEMVKELKRRNPRGHTSPTGNFWTVIKKPACPTCSVELRFETCRPIKRMSIEP